MLHEIMVDADKAYWLRRADQFEAAGLDEIATACRNKASLCEPEDWADDLNNVMSERH